MENNNLNEQTENLGTIPSQESVENTTQPIEEVSTPVESVVEPIAEQEIIDPETMIQSEPVVEEPVQAEASVTEQMVTEEPVISESVVEPVTEPVVKEGAPTEASVTEQMVTEEPVVEVASEPIVSETPVVESTAVAEEVKEKPKKVKKGGSAPILFIIIIILLLVVLYMLFGKKLFNKEKPVTPAPQVTVQEYVSFNSSDYLKIKSDGTYELNLTSSAYTEPEKVRDKKGSYTKSDQSYALDNGGIATVYSDYVEINNIINGDEQKREEILFDRSKLDNARNAINSAITTYITNEQDNAKTYDIPRAEVVSVSSELRNCFRTTTIGDIDKSSIKCEANYTISLKDYDYNACLTGLNNNQKAGYQFWSWTKPNGSCQENGISRTGFFSLDQNNNYNILSEETGI